MSLTSELESINNNQGKLEAMEIDESLAEMQTSDGESKKKTVAKIVGKRRRGSQSEGTDAETVTGSEDPQSTEDDETEETIYCFCRQPSDGKFMIACDFCHEWFHGRCVNITKAKANHLDNWNCPECEKKVNGSEKAQPLTKYEPQSKKGAGRKRAGSTSSSGPTAADSSGDWRLDPVRKRVAENMEKVLRLAFKNLKSSEKFPETLDIHQLAIRIEAAMFQQLHTKGASGRKTCGEEYKEKFRSLHFNLKEAHNACRVLMGELQPDELIPMAAEDFADEQLKKMKEEIHQQSIRETILTESQAAVILKRTRKAELLSAVPIKVENSANDLEIAESMIKSAISPTDSEDSSALNTADKSSVASPPAQVADNSASLSAATAGSGDTLKALPPASSGGRNQAQPHEESTTLESAVSGESRRQSAVNLDELLAKLKNDSGSVRVLPAKHEREDAQQQQSQPQQRPVSFQSPAQEHPAVSVTVHTSTTAASRASFIWNGRVNMAGVGAFNGTAKQVGGREIESDFEWEELLPAVLSIDGRIPPDRVHPYLQNMCELATHDILLIEFTPDDQTDFRIVYDYFHSKQRYAVIGNKFIRVKDMYLVPVAKDEPLPPFLEMVEHRLAARQRPEDILLGVMIVSRKNGGGGGQPDQKRLRVSSSSAYTPAAASSSAALPTAATTTASALPVDTSHIQNLLNTLMPAATAAPVQQQPPIMGSHGPYHGMPYPGAGPPMQMPSYYGGTAPQPPPPGYYPPPGGPPMPYGGPPVHSMMHHRPPQSMPPQQRRPASPPRGDRRGPPGGARNSQPPPPRRR